MSCLCLMAFKLTQLDSKVLLDRSLQQALVHTLTLEVSNHNCFKVQGFAKFNQVGVALLRN